MNLDFFRKVVYNNFTKKNVIFLAAPEIEILNQILFVIKKWPKEWHGNAKKKKIENLSSTLYFEKTKKN